MNFKKLICFSERDFDWWTFALLPIVLTILICIIVFITSLKDNRLFYVILIFVQQLFSYAIVLSSTDIGLRSKSVGEKRQLVGLPLLVIFISLVSLVYIYIMEVQVLESLVILLVSLVLGVAMGYSSIWLYNNNPDSDSNKWAEKIIHEKEKQEENAKNEFEPKKSKRGIK